MKELELRALPLELGEGVEEDNTLSGVVNVPGSQSEILTNPITGKKFREVIEPGTFAKALEEAKSVDFLYQHDKEKILSTTDNNSLELTETEDAGLIMRAKITQTSWGKDAYEMIKDGIVRSMSFGMNVLNDTWMRGDDGIPLRIIDKINLIEVSAVRNPAYAASAIEARGIDIAEVEIPDMEERDLAEAKHDEEVKKDETPKTEDVKEVKKPENDEKSESKKESTPTKKRESTPTEKKDDEAPKKEDDKKPEDEKREATDEKKSVTASVSLDDESKALINSLLTALKAEKRDDGIVEDRKNDDDSEVREDEQTTKTKDEEPKDEVVDDSEPEERQMTESEKAILEFFA